MDRPLGNTCESFPVDCSAQSSGNFGSLAAAGTSSGVLRKLLSVLGGIMLATLVPPQIHAQTAPTDPDTRPFAPTSGSKIDSVSLVNGRLQASIPLWSVPQRGNLSLSFSLQYANPQYTIDKECLIPGKPCKSYVTPTSGFSVLVISSTNVSMAPSAYQTSTGTIVGYVWELTTPDGGTHNFASIGNHQFRSEDGTGWLYNENTEILTSRDGVHYVFAYLPPVSGNPVPRVGSLSYIEDTNGNQIHLNRDSNGNLLSWTDSMGRTIVPPLSATTTDTSHCPNSSSVTNVYTWNPPGYGGATQQSFYFCFSNVNIRTRYYNGSGYPDFGTTTTATKFEDVETDSVMTGVVDPVGNEWQFSYTPPSGGVVNYGELTSLTTPQGGTLSYQWYDPTGGSTTGCDSAFFSQVTQRELSPGGSGLNQLWSYSYSGNYIYPGTLTTTVTALGDGSKVVHHLTGLSNSTSFYETETDYLDSTGATLRTDTTQYSSQPDYNVIQVIPCNPPLAMGVMPTSRTTSWANGATKQTTYSNDSGFSGTSYQGTQANLPYGLVVQKSDYDYGSGAAGALLATTSTSYLALSDSSSLANNLLDLVSAVTVTDGKTGQQSTTTYGYDQYALAPGTAGGVGWNSSPMSTKRGNQTSISRYWDTSGTYLTTQKTYYNTGLLATATEPANSGISGSLTTSYQYSGTYDGAYLTQVTDPKGHVATSSYDFSSGLVTSKTDPNSQTTSYTYDQALRLLTETHPGGDHNLASSITYSYPNPTTVQRTAQLNTSIAPETDITTYDGLGEVINTHRIDPADGDTYVDTTYDALGRTLCVTTPYHAINDPYYATNCNSYDALGRVIKTTNSFDGTYTTSQFAGATTLSTSQSNGNTTPQRMTRVDGLGRLIAVCEITTSATPPQQGGDAPVSCGMEISGTGLSGFLTSYTQTTRGMTAVAQGVQSRTFSYDSLGQLTDSTNPESGHIHYTYDSDGNVVSKTMPAANTLKSVNSTLTISYQYNNVHQILQKTYSGSGPAGTTPISYFNYDETAVDGETLEYPAGRLTSEYTSLNGIIQAKSVYSYDTDGRVASHYQCVLTACTASYKDVEYHYDGVGNVTQLSTPYLGYNATYNQADHLTTLQPIWTADSNHPATLVSLHYAPNGGWLTASYGNGITETDSYTPRWQTGLQVKNSTTTLYSYTLQHAPDAQITQSVDLVNGTWNYKFDDFNRLITANKVDVNNNVLTGLGWDYDRYGNRWHQNLTAGSGTSNLLTMNAASNQATTVLSYDAGGNAIGDGGHNFTYDAENRIANVSGSLGYIYDAEGRRVGKSDGTVYIVGLSGQVLDEVDSGTWKRSEVNAAGKHIATVVPSTVYFNHADWLGTERARTNMSAQRCESISSQPFGDNEQASGTCNTSPNFFTGKQRDAESNLDDFGARYFSSTNGRWMSPDWSASPTGVPYSTLTNPQSLNLYAYVGNDPIDGEDPDGHARTDGGNDPDYDSGTWNPDKQDHIAAYFGARDALLVDDPGDLTMPMTVARDGTTPASKTNSHKHKGAGKPPAKPFQSCSAEVPTSADARLLSQLIAGEATMAINSTDEMAAIGYSAVNRVDYLQKNPDEKSSLFSAPDGTLKGIIVDAKGQFGSVGNDLWTKSMNPSQFNINTVSGAQACSFLTNVYATASKVLAGTAKDPFVSYGGSFGFRTAGHGLGLKGTRFTRIPASAQIPGSGNTFYSGVTGK